MVKHILETTVNRESQAAATPRRISRQLCRSRVAEARQASHVVTDRPRPKLKFSSLPPHSIGVTLTMTLGRAISILEIQPKISLYAVSPRLFTQCLKLSMVVVCGVCTGTRSQSGTAGWSEI